MDGILVLVVLMLMTLLAMNITSFVLVQTAKRDVRRLIQRKLALLLEAKKRTSAV